MEKERTSKPDMGTRVTGENLEEKEDHPQELIGSTPNNDVKESTVNCVVDVVVDTDKSKVTGTATSPPQPTMAEDAEEYIKPIIKDGEVILEVECGQNKALLYLSKLCQGSKGPCIYFQGSWLAPNEFQYVSGRETAKDWKRSIRHHGKSLKLLLAKGILSVHPTVCDCEGCRTGSTLNRNRNGTKKKTPVNKESKPKTTTDSVKPVKHLSVPDLQKANTTISNPDGDKVKKDVKKINKKLSDKPVSPLKESKSTNIMNTTDAVTEERVPKIPAVPCPVVHSQFPAPKIPVLSPIKPARHDVTPTVAQAQNDEPSVNKTEIPITTLDSRPLSIPVISTPNKLPEPKQFISSVPKPDGSKENIKRDTKPMLDIKIEKYPDVKEAAHPKPDPTKSSPESSKTKDTPSRDIHKMSPEPEKTTPKQIPAFMPRLGSEVPAFRHPEPSPLDSALYSDYMRMFQPGHHLMPSAPIDPLVNLRGTDPSYHPGLHPFHGCTVYNPHPSAMYTKDPIMLPSAPLQPSLASSCFTPMHMLSQRSPYSLPSSMMDFTRPFGYIPIPPPSLPYNCSSVGGLKRHHPDFESSSDIANKRFRLDYPVPDFRLDPYSSCSTAYPPYYESSLLHSEEYRRKRLEECFNYSKDLSGYMLSYHNKPGYGCNCSGRSFDIRNWSVEDVCSFISRLDGCNVYAETFREQKVDGKILSLLTTEHLMKNLGLKLGPAVLISEAVVKKLQEIRLGGCESCKMTLGPSSVEM